jgi:ESS family glutamate:Na+ symporter
VEFLINNVIGLLYGFNFIIVVFMGMLYKVISRQLLRKKVMRRIYTNDFMLNRIAGFAFDVMMISSIMAIDISVVVEPGFIITLITIGFIGGLATYGYVGFITKKVYPNYTHEAFLVFYGTITGTASTGVALLREKDPYFKTPATNDIVYGSSMAIPLGFPLLLFVGIVYQGWLQLGTVLVTLIVIFTTYHLVLTRQKKTKKVIQSSTKVS